LIRNQDEEVISFSSFFFQKQQNSLIAGLRATNNAATTAQDQEKGKEEKGKEINIDREEETETKVHFVSHFYFASLQHEHLCCKKS